MPSTRASSRNHPVKETPEPKATPKRGRKQPPRRVREEHEEKPRIKRNAGPSLSPTIGPEIDAQPQVTERALAGAVLADTLKAFDPAPGPEIYGTRDFALGVVIDALQAAKMSNGSASAHAVHEMRVVIEPDNNGNGGGAAAAAVTRDVQTTVYASSTYLNRMNVSVSVMTLSTAGWSAPSSSRRTVEARRGIEIADLRVMPAVRGMITGE